MKYNTEYQVLQIADIIPAPYNPREELLPESDEYQGILRSIQEHGMIEPPVVNLHNMRCIGGNQRLTVLRDMGETEVLCSVIRQPNELQEKKLCFALNRIGGRWDAEKLGFLLRDDDVLAFETGFNHDEVMLYRQLEASREPELGGDEDDLLDRLDDTLGGDEEPDDFSDDEEDLDPGEEDHSLDSIDAATILVKVGHLKFKAEVSKYRRLLESLRDDGIFDEKQIAQEIKRRLLTDD